MQKTFISMILHNTILINYGNTYSAGNTMWQMNRGDFNPGSDEPQHCRPWACLHDNNALKMKRVFFAFLEGLAYR